MPCLYLSDGPFNPEKNGSLPATASKSTQGASELSPEAAQDSQPGLRTIKVQSSLVLDQFLNVHGKLTRSHLCSLQPSILPKTHTFS